MARLPSEVTCPHDLPVRPAEPFTLDQCRVCWLAQRAAAGLPVRPTGGGHPATRPSARAAAPRKAALTTAAGQQPSAVSLYVVRPPCPHEGGVLERCHTCSKDLAELRHVRECDVYGKCVRDRRAGQWDETVHGCWDRAGSCKHYQAVADSSPQTNQPTPQATTDQRGREAGSSPAAAETAPSAPAPTHSAAPPTPVVKRPARPALVWACGLTTVPERTDDLLPRTLGSLYRAGFPRPVLFVDGCDDPKTLTERLAARSPWFVGLKVSARWVDARHRGQPHCTHPRGVRLFGNFILGLWELYLREPAADRYAMFQDDVQFPTDLRGYLDAVPLQPKTYWNLYTVPDNQRRCPPGHAGFYPSNQLGKGALALVFDRPGVQALLTSYDHIVHRPTVVGERSWRNVDGGVVDALKAKGYREMVHSPSLCQHVAGHTSSIGTGPEPIATSFRGEGWSALTLLVDPNPSK